MRKIRERNVGTTRKMPFFQTINTYQHRLSDIGKRAGTYQFRQIAKAGIIYEETCRAWQMSDAVNHLCHEFEQL
jgi:hypothetical protein